MMVLTTRIMATTAMMMVETMTSARLGWERWAWSLERRHDGDDENQGWNVVEGLMMMTIEKIKTDYLSEARLWAMSVKSWESGRRGDWETWVASSHLDESLYCALATLTWRLWSSFCIFCLCLTSPSLCGDSWEDLHDNRNLIILNHYLYLCIAHLSLSLWGLLSGASSVCGQWWKPANWPAKNKR